MKLNTSTHKAEGSGFQKVSGFRMDMNEKAARVLSDTLYKDKFGAIIRELSCNAFDAHVEAGIGDTPFELSLPDAFNPQLRIRDFGKGISPEDIEGVYCTYFGSTKDHSNDAVGAFGLGSKTPFAYTDSFMVTSIYDGVKRIYNAYMDSGIPTISQFGDGEKTDEPNGLEVTVTVEKKDIASFKDAVRKQLRFFPVKPKVNIPIDWPQVYSNILEVDGFSIFKTTDGLLRGFFIKQGPVAYPVDFEVLFNYYNNNNKRVPEILKHLNSISVNRSYYYSNNGTGAILDMPIGTIEIVPSREGISYKETTLKNIEQAIENVSNNLFQAVKDTMHDKYAEGYKEFIKFYNSLESFMRASIDPDYIEKNFKPFFVSGNMRQLHILMPKKFSGIEISTYYRDSKNSRKHSVKRTDRWKSQKDDDGNPISYEESIARYKSLDFALSNDDCWIKDDTYAFATRSNNNTNTSRYFVIDKGTLSEDTLKEFGKFLSKFATVRYISETSRPVKNGNSGGHSTTGGRKRSWFKLDMNKVRKIGGHFLFSETLYAQNHDSEYDETIKDYDGDTLLYVTTHNNKINKFTGELDKMYLITMNYATLIDDMSFVAIPSKDEAKAKKSNHFMSLEEYYEKNKGLIVNAVEKALNDRIKAIYFDRASVRSLIKTLQELGGDMKLEGMENIDIPDDDPKTVSVLTFVGNVNFEQAMRVIDRSDLIDKCENGDEIFHSSYNISEVHDKMEKAGISFTPVTDTLNEIKSVLKNKKNIVPVLKLGMSTVLSHYEKIIIDPWSRNTRLFDFNKIINEIIEDLA